MSIANKYMQLLEYIHKIPDSVRENFPYIAGVHGEEFSDWLSYMFADKIVEKCCGSIFES